MTQPFALLLPGTGNSLLTEFTPTDPSNMKFTLSLPFLSPSQHSTGIDNPLLVSDLVFCLLPGVPLPPNTGAFLYWSASSNDHMLQQNNIEFDILGVLSSSKISGIFRTGWGSNEPLHALIQSSSSAGITMKFGVSIEPLENAHNIGIDVTGIDYRGKTAKNVALDLFNYMRSFDDGSGGKPGWMTVPNNIFDRWLKRFEGKLERDPNFFMKT